MFNITSGLRRLRKAGQAGGGYDSNPQSFSFNGSTGYIQQVGYSGGVVRKQNDGSRDYWQCYGGYFNIGDSAVHGLDNRSVQTMKFVFQIDDNLNTVTLGCYNNLGGVEIVASTGIVQIYLPGTGSIQIRSTNTITPGQIYCVVVKINNTLPFGTARVVGDADIFINGVKESKTTAVLGNATATQNILFWGANNATTQLFRGRLYNFSLWNRALSDAECQAEGLNNRSVVTPSGLVNTWDTTDTSQAISRTGYSLNVAGNVTTGTDSDGKYIFFNGNRNTSTGTSASATATTAPTLNQTTAFTIKARFKFNGIIPSTLACGIFGRQNITAIYANNVAGVNQLSFRIRNGATVTEAVYNSSTSTLYDGYLVFDPVAYKIYAYISVAGGTSTLLNAGGTTVAAATFGGSQNFIIGDDAVGGGNTGSTPLQVYHTRVRARALTQSDINADIALGNNTNNDPTIVASYRPDNLINQQFMSNPTELDNASWTKLGGTTVTPNNVTAPDGTLTADTVSISGTAGQGIQQANITLLTGSSLSSKTFIIKAFVKVPTGTALFRLSLAHRSVLDYNSADLTATTSWQEFTRTATFGASTAGTGVSGSILNSTGATNPTLQVRNVRVFLVNEILYDNSPNIGGFMGPLTNRYISGWIKPGVDAINDANGNPIMNLGYGYSYIRGTTNVARIRYDDRVGTIEASGTLGTGFRNWVHFIGGIERNGTAFSVAVRINGVLVQRTTISYLDASHALSLSQIQIWLGRWSTRYFTGSMRDMRIYTSPTALTDAQALMITNGGDPMDVTKVLHRDALPSDTTNYVTDKSGNGRVGYITGGVTKTF